VNLLVYQARPISLAHWKLSIAQLQLPVNERNGSSSIDYELINWEASSIEMELFNDIHGDSGCYLHQTVSSTSLQRRLATVASQVPRAYSHTLRTIADRLVIIFMTYTMHLSMVFVFVGDMVGVRLDRGSLLGSALA